MNLSAYVKDADLSTEKAGWFDFESFGRDAKVAMRLLDNVIDQTYYFFKENEKCAKDIRRTGLGIMGLGDALIKMQLPYGSDESMPVIEKIFKTLRDSAYEASADLASEKGVFPKFDKEKYMEGYHIKALPKKIREKVEKQGIRNAVLLTIAPTGTTSLVSGVSSGVEPVYEFSFLRRWRGGEEIIYHPLFEEWKKAHPEGEKPGYFVSANDLTPLEHVRVQAVAQEYIDSSISKTVNAPNSHTIDDVKTLYMMAYDMGLKGVTYMRDGSRQGVLERVDEKKKEEEVKEAQAMPIRKRPLALTGVTHETQTPLGNTFITINHDSEGRPFELFINSGKSGSDVMAMSEALGRIMSMVLRMQSPVEPRERIREMIDQLTGIGGGRSVGFGPNRVRSLPDAVAKVLAEHFEFRVNGHVSDRNPMKLVLADATKPVLADATADATKQSEPAEIKIESTVATQAPLPTMVAAPGPSTNADLCPQCGAAAFVHEEGCAKCYACGHAEC
jgi:ribonucleoside-diphosphate reductase alpha chain